MGSTQSTWGPPAHVPRLAPQWIRRKHCVFVSAESHYSVLMAGNVIGLGYNNIVKVKCDNDGRMIPSELEKEIANAKASGKIPLAVVGTAGTTVRGCFDPFKDISAVCKKDNIWFHIDGAWGGSILFSPKYRHHATALTLLTPCAGISTR